jgi:elongation factor Ts
MPEATSGQIKLLREKTGARMLDCQQALKECRGNVEEAVVWLRKRNLAAGESARARAAQEGLLGCRLSPDGRAITFVELSANTDFVTRNAEFRRLLEKLCELAAGLGLGAADQLLRQRLDGRAVAEVVQELAGRIGENVAIRRVVRVEGDFGYYLHHDNKQAAVVELAGAVGERAAAVGKELAMHVVFAKPGYLSRQDVPQEVLDKEKEIVAERLKTDPRNANKPPQILAKIAEGQLGKFYAGACLLDQPFCREASKSVAAYLKEQGAGIAVKRFVHLKVGA